MDSARGSAPEEESQDSQASSSVTEQKKRRRTTVVEMIEIQKAKLDKKRNINTTGWTEKRNLNHQQAIDALPTRTDADIEHQQRLEFKRAKRTSTATVQAPPMKEDETRRLI
jgi:hypothetical protein